MKVLLDIKDDQAVFFMEQLKSFSFVKAKTLTPSNARILVGLKNAVEEVNLSKAGKIKLKSVRQLLNEL